MSETQGQRLQRLRQGAGLSQPQLAAAAGVPVSSLRNWEQDRRPLFLETAGLLAKALGVSLDALAVIPEPGPATEAEPVDPADEAAADRRGLTGKQREEFIRGRREMRAELAAASKPEPAKKTRKKTT